MKVLLVAIALLPFPTGCIQPKDEYVTQAYEPILMPPEQRIDKIKTDSSLIEVKYFEDLNSIREFNRLDSVDRTYYRDYYFTTCNVKEAGIIEDGICAGIWKYFNENGKLIKKIDYETGQKTLYDGKTEPYDDLLLKAKGNADSILQTYFGANFFHSHIRWNPNDSHFFGYESSGTWFDVPAEMPTEFRFSYYILLDDDHRYPTIQFTLDRWGDMKTSEEISGLKTCGPNSCQFAIDYSQALEVGRSNGLLLNKERNYFIYLR